MTASKGRSGHAETGLSFAASVLTIVLGLGTQAALGRLLAPAGRGSYAVCMVLVSVLGTVFSLGTDRATQYFVSSQRLSAATGFWMAAVSGGAGSIVAVALGIAAVHTPFKFFTKASTHEFMLALTAVPGTILLGHVVLQLAALRRFGTAALVSISQSAINLTLLLVLAWRFEFGVVGALWATTGGVALAVLLGLTVLVRDISPTRADFDLRFLGELFRYSARYFVARLGNITDVSLNGFAVGALATPAAIGFFSVANALMLRLGLFSDAIESPLLIRIANSPDGRPELVSRCGRLMAALMLLVIGALLLVSRPLITFLMSAEFLPSVRLMWIIAPGMFFATVSKVFMPYFTGTNRPGICSLSIWLGAFANLATVLVLYPRMGIAAAALAMSVGFGVRSAIVMAAYLVATRQSAAEAYLPSRGDLAFVIGLGRRLIANMAS